MWRTKKTNTTAVVVTIYGQVKKKTAKAKHGDQQVEQVKKNHRVLRTSEH